MAFVKCPRCELNYIPEGEKYCDICRRELKGEDDQEVEVDICVECNENPVVQGEDLCIYCLREKKQQDNLELLADKDRIDETLVLPGVGELDEIDIDTDADIPPPELDEIDKELGIDIEEIDDIADLPDLEEEPLTPPDDLDDEDLFDDI